MLRQARMIIGQSLADLVNDWLTVLPEEVGDLCESGESEDDLLESLVRSGFLPKYAFPVDVVRLSIPDDDSQEDRYESQDFYSGIPRDRQIALTE